MERSITQGEGIAATVHPGCGIQRHNQQPIVYLDRAPLVLWHLKPGVVWSKNLERVYIKTFQWIPCPFRHRPGLSTALLGTVSWEGEAYNSKWSHTGPGRIGNFRSPREKRVAPRFSIWTDSSWSWSPTEEWKPWCRLEIPWISWTTEVNRSLLWIWLLWARSAVCTVSESAESMFGQFVLSRLGDNKQMDLNAQLDTVHFETIARHNQAFWVLWRDFTLGPWQPHQLCTIAAVLQLSCSPIFIIGCFYLQWAGCENITLCM